MKTCAREGCTQSMEHRATQARFCSDSCRTKSSRPRPPATCKRCASPIGDRHGNARFCSRSCAKAFKNAAYYQRHLEINRAKRRAYREAHIEDTRRRNAEYYARMKDDPDYKNKRTEYGRRYYLTHREEMRAYGAWYRKTYPEQWAAKNAAWLAANPDKRRDYRAKRRALEMMAYVEDVSRTVVWERDNGVCHICQQPADPTDWHLDHVVPLAKGGVHSYANTAVSHPSCNLSKGARLL